MAIFARYEALRKEIKALVAENEELKQLVLLLRENQELKSLLHDQFNERNLLPNFESSRLDQQEPLANQAFLDSSNLDQSQNSQNAILRLGIRQRHPSGLTAQLTTQYPPPPPPPGAMAASLRGSPPRFQVCSPAGSTSGVGGASQRSSGSSIVPRGYCFECPIPWHPHLPSTSAGVPLLAPTSLPDLPSTQLTSVLPGSSLPNLPAARQGRGTYSIPSAGGRTYSIPSPGGGTFSIPSPGGGMPKWHIASSELPSIQQLSQLPSVFYSPTGPTAGQGRGTYSIPCDEGMPKWHIASSELPSIQQLSQLPSVFCSPTGPTAGQGRGTYSIPCDEGMPSWNIGSAELPSIQQLSQLPSVFGSPTGPTAGQGRGTYSIPGISGTPEAPSTQNLSQLTSVFGSSLPSTQLLSQLPSAFLSPTQPASAGQGGGTFPLSCIPGTPEAPSTQNLSHLTSVFRQQPALYPAALPAVSAFLSPTQPASAGQGGGTFPLSCIPGTPEAPSTQNLSHLTSVFGSSLPSTQLLSQLPSAFLSPTQAAAAFPFPCIPGTPEAPSTQYPSQLPSIYMKPTSGQEGGMVSFPQGTPEAPSTQNLSHLTSVFGSNLPSTQLLSQLSSAFSPKPICGRDVSMSLPTQQQPFQPIEASSPIQPIQGANYFSSPGSPELSSMQSPLPSMYMKPIARQGGRIFTFPSVPGSPELSGTLPSIYMKPTVRQRQRIFTFPTILGGPELPSPQYPSQLPSIYMKPTSGQEGGMVSFPQGTPEAPSTQNLSHLTSVFGSSLPSTQLLSQLSSAFSPKPICGRDVSMSLPTQQQPFQPIEASSPIQPIQGANYLSGSLSSPSGPCPPSYMVPSWDSYGGLQLPPPVGDPFSQFSSDIFSMGSDPGKPQLPAMPSISPTQPSRYLRFPGDIYNLGGDPYCAPYSPGQFSPYSPSGTFSQLGPCSPFSPGSSGMGGTPTGSPFFPLAPGSPDMSSLYGPMAPGSPMTFSGGPMTPMSGTTASSGNSVFSSLVPDSSLGTIPSPYSSLGACSPFGVVPPASSPDTSSLYGPMFPASYVSSLYGPMVPASPTSSGSPLFSSGPSSLFSPLGPAGSPGTICVPSPIQFSPLATSPTPALGPRPITSPMLPSPMLSPAVSPEPTEKSDRRTQGTAMGRGL
ncbi:speriolin isoform X2 [Pantherophis guttatus]|uniref:Speriolin isoform X2 n=1 Tax=Pantherophis guttatus TaxID=94885 RepID=A0ABM3YPT7_PANGU|nr:speriolin isoform X2 [Pantherophis guttatus]